MSKILNIFLILLYVIYINASLVPFFITPNKDSDQIQKVKLGNTECILKYNTKDVVQKSTQKYPPVKDFIEEITRKLGKKCIDSSKDGWQYKLCLGEQITQFLSGQNAIENNLGSYRGFAVEKEDVHQIYEGGNPRGCPQETPRSSLVKFACGDQMRIDSIAENTVCVYTIVVSLPDVCGHPAFPQAVHSVEQSWILEMNKNTEGGLECSARITGFGNSAAMTFSSFSLSFSSIKQIDSFSARYSYTLSTNLMLQRAADHCSVDAEKISEIEGGIEINSQAITFAEIYSIQSKL